jgi:hypothetical protein
MKALRIGKYVLTIGHYHEAREIVLAVEARAEDLLESQEERRFGSYDRLRGQRLLEIAGPIDEAMVRAQEAHIAKTVPTVPR